MHTVLNAIATSKSLRYSMVMKGGVLLAIKYQSTRFTKDIDFSTAVKLKDFDRDAFLEELGDRLTEASDRLDYGLECQIQSHKIEPAKENPTFPTFKIKIGYAYKHDSASYRRLRNGNASTVVKVDYSLNEQTWDVDSLSLSDDGELQVYNVYEIVAEKFRAILQQTTRNRHRRQDAYDLYCLFEKITFSDQEKIHILEILMAKSASRGLEISPESISDSEIIRRSESEYASLQPEIEGDLPNFEEAYSVIQSFYESLPWAQKRL
ncbi:MAG: nucleotidyl transferase AbiEii/AbiGii toxin family protein [Desulfobulbaceae bacterium]|nr:MAG: nucleotidyl transferase AbiEii/AbiGii toxin family protein [Desulfobulbaceae bacterium]